MNKSIFQRVYDFVGFPLRVLLLTDTWYQRLGLTTLGEERLLAALPYVKGNLLDIGCGQNNLVRLHGKGIGLDIYKWKDDVFIVEDSSSIPMESRTFDTIAFLGCLNHIPNREETTNESFRLLKDDGRVIVTMINPIFGFIMHSVWWHGEEKRRGGMARGEIHGMWKRDVIKMFERNGFELELHKRFVHGLNNLFIFRKNPDYLREHF